MARRNAHVQDVQAMQKEMQNMDLHIECETGSIGSRKFQYVWDAAVGAKKHIARLQQFYGFAEKGTS